MDSSSSLTRVSTKCWVIFGGGGRGGGTLGSLGVAVVRGEVGSE